MDRQRRQLMTSSLGVLGVAGAAPAAAADDATITSQTFAEAEKLLGLRLTPAQRDMLAATWPPSIAGLGTQGAAAAFVPAESDAPAQVFQPMLGHPLPKGGRFVRSTVRPVPLPAAEADIAFAPLTQLSHWIEQRAISSERLTRLYLDRIARLDGGLRSFITVTPGLALQQAVQADRDIAAGRWRGPLHGVPYGVKDLLDTAGVRTTWGAEPMREHVPQQDATVIARLHAAGAVLLGKLSLGALAMNDVWFGGQTMNPWVPEEGASGSSAGPGAATAAGLVGFSIASETTGSIISPSMRCGVVGLRPSFGRVPRTGAMTLSWSLDKLGVMSRGAEDTMLVLQAIAGPDGHDPSAIAAPLAYDGRSAPRGLTVGVVPAWLEQAPATEADHAALERARQLGWTVVPLSMPEAPYPLLNAILLAEAAASFDAWLRDGRLDQLRMQTPDAWPHTLRQARFLSAADVVQADRLRRRCAQWMAGVMAQVDLLLVPSLREDMMVVTNHTGQPSLTLPCGTQKIDQARSDWAPDPARPLPRFDPPRVVPNGITLVGRLFEEGALVRAGIALTGGKAPRPPSP